MKTLLIIWLTPLLLIPLAGIGLHRMLCEMHVAAVDGMRDKQASSDRQGWAYNYCKFMAVNLHRIL
jgi:hypothetical protein